jgi:5'-methylthioadenosine phosphorylase
MHNPSTAIIGGSGLYDIDSIQVIKQHQIETPFGTPSDLITEGTLADRPVFFLARHGKGHRLTAHEINHRANIWALRSLNVRWIVSVTAVGSLRENMKPRNIVIPHQLVDRTGRTHEHTFFGNGIAAHISLADPYSQQLRELIINASSQHTNKLHTSGTYVTMNGPAFSTRAESDMHRSLGFDLIGMTNAPEARLAREAEIAYATICMVTDFDCWKNDEPPVEVATVIENLNANSNLAKKILKSLIPSIPVTPTWPEHNSLASAILTPPHLWPDETRNKLAPILQNF